MHFVSYGINHQSAPVAIRERLAFSVDTIPAALHALYQLPEVEGAVIVSTCNRTEIYCQLHPNKINTLTNWLHQYHQLPSDSLEPHLYRHHDQDAIRHLFRVACGLDSMVLGEPQILGQIKTAYSQALNANTLGKPLGKLFQHTFTVAKQVRTDTEIGNSPISIAFAAVNLAKRIFADLPTATAMLIGAGETIDLTARHLKDNGVDRIIIANRTVEHAHQLAQQFNGYGISLSEIPNHLAEADIVISATASQLPILGKGTIERALKQRKRRPIFMVDIAVPRDIEPEVSRLDDIYLYTVDDLHNIIEESRQSRRDAAKQAEEIIDHHVDQFAGWLRSQETVPTITALRIRLEQESEDLLSQAKKDIQQGQPAEEVLAEFSRQLSQKLLHSPCQQLHDAGVNGDNGLIDAARTLFNIKDSPS
jgi:glutamyl-tRNA reductase